MGRFKYAARRKMPKPQNRGPRLGGAGLQSLHWLGRAMGGARTAPSGHGRDRRAEQGRAGAGTGGRASGCDRTWRRVRTLHSPGVSARPRLALRCAPGPPSPQGALSPPVVSGADAGRKSVRQSLPARSSGCGGGAGGRWGWTRTGQARPLIVPRRRPGLGGRCGRRAAPGPPQCRSCTASGGSSSSTSRWWMRFSAPWGSRTPSGRSPWMGNSLPSRRPGPLRPGAAVFLSLQTGGRGVSVSQKRPAEAGAARLRVRAPPRWALSCPVQGAERRCRARWRALSQGLSAHPVPGPVPSTLKLQRSWVVSVKASIFTPGQCENELFPAELAF